MATVIPTIPDPELFFGFVAPVGVDLSPCLDAFRLYLEEQKYLVISIKVTHAFALLERVVSPKKPLVHDKQYQRYLTHIAYGNQLRSHFKDDSFLAAASIAQVYRERKKRNHKRTGPHFSKVAYLVHQFKRKEEVDLFRSVYGRLFFQVSVYSRRGARVDYLARKFARANSSSQADSSRSDAEALIQQDENEVAVKHGQRVGKIFHDADFIVNADISSPNIVDQVRRFGELVFGANNISPTKMEYGMFLAKAAALRTIDLSRQVGAAIFTQAGEIISLGSNEVPKAGGGTYWSDERQDDRDWARGYDSNDRRKRELLMDLLTAKMPKADALKWINDRRIKDSFFMDALEYGRIVHAEMSAISDAARCGHSIRDSILYSTTFPCHMCAKHIVAAGVSKVFFLEPYPKSLASELHSDSIQVEGTDRGIYSGFRAVSFEHFHGVTPRRYRELFERGKRKDENGNFQRYRHNHRSPIIDIRYPLYFNFEKFVIEQSKGPVTKELSSSKRRAKSKPRRTKA